MITVSIATLFERKEALAELLESIIDKVDSINIFAHNYIPDNIPAILQDKKINIVYDYEYSDNGDLDKFFWVDEVKQGFHFILDDDLILPDDYFDKSIKLLQENSDRVISYHGADIYKPPIANYYKDRIVYPVLGELEMNIFDPCIIGTGVMFYNAEVINLGEFKKYLKDKPANMADIHFAIYAHKNKIPLMVASHKKDWIKHSDKVRVENTIAGRNFHNPYLMTKYINENKDIFEYYYEDVEYEPLITIGVIISRLARRPDYVKQCLDSIRKQTYKNIEVITVDNDDKLITIGKAFNTVARKGKGEYVLYIGDDDYIAPDYVGSLVAMLKENLDNDKIAGVSSYLTMFKTSGEQVLAEHRTLVPTGMWKREIILEEQFREYLTKYVDSEFADRIRAKGYIQLIAEHNYGYFYRAHEQQISGFKTFSNENGHSVNTEKFKNYLETLEV